MPDREKPPFMNEVYAANRARLSVKDLDPYATQWVALARDGSAILAGAAELPDLEKVLVAKGIDPSDVVYEYIPDEDTLFGGAELL